MILNVLLLVLLLLYFLLVLYYQKIYIATIGLVKLMYLIFYEINQILKNFLSFKNLSLY